VWDGPSHPSTTAVRTTQREPGWEKAAFHGGIPSSFTLRPFCCDLPSEPQSSPWCQFVIYQQQ
jgi:hypothetical protein